MNSDQLQILIDLADKLIANHRKEAEKKSKDKASIKDEPMTLSSDIDNYSLNDSAINNVANSAFIKAIFKRYQKKVENADKERESNYDESQIYNLDTELLKIGFKESYHIRDVYAGWVKDNIAIYSTACTCHILKDNREVCALSRDAKKWEVLQRVIETIK